jgi:hypothetical protein
MVDAKTLKTQTWQALQQQDVRRAIASYELIQSANIMLAALPKPVLEALRDYAEERIKERTGKPPLTMCERHYMEHLNELIEGARIEEMRLVQAVTGIVPPPE